MFGIMLILGIFFGSISSFMFFTSTGNTEFIGMIVPSAIGLFIVGIYFWCRFENLEER